MPLYTYKNKQTSETRDVFQGMNDVHEYAGENGDEEWQRVFQAPNAAIDTKVDPYDNKSFVEKTGAKKGTVGDMLDLSQELSDQRAADQGGVDPVKKQYFEDYAKKRKGTRHQDEKKSLNTKDISVEY
jgi:hypothetical protein